MADGCSVCGERGSDGKLRRGLCKKHYVRWQQHGDPTVVLRTMPDNRGTPEHGMLSKYTAGCRCEPCGAANSAYLKRWRSENRVKTWVATQEKRGVPVDSDGVAYARVLFADPCSYCGGPTEVIDHIQAVSAGGTSDWRNLTGSCARCNKSKHAKPLLQYLLREVSRVE